MQGQRLLPKPMKILLASYVIVFVVTSIVSRFGGIQMVYYLGLVPQLAVQKGFVWQFITYSFMHGDLWHLLWNGFALWMLGTELMFLWGAREFFKFYVVCVVGAAMAKVLATYVLVPLILGPSAQQEASFIPMVGSSGAIYGLLAAYAIFFGEQIMYVMFLFPMKAKHVALLLGLISLWQTVMEQEQGVVGGVAHSAHLGGMVVGFLYLYIKTQRKLRGRGQQDTERAKMKTRFRVIVNQNFNRDGEGGDPPSDPNRWN